MIWPSDINVSTMSCTVPLGDIVAKCKVPDGSTTGTIKWSPIVCPVQANYSETLTTSVRG